MKTKHLVTDRIKDVGKIPDVDHTHIRAALGDDTPHGINSTHIGEFKLKQALRNKFGENYGSHPKAKQALDHYTVQRDTHRLFVKAKMGIK